MIQKLMLWQNHLWQCLHEKGIGMLIRLILWGALRKGIWEMSKGFTWSFGKWLDGYRSISFLFKGAQLNIRWNVKDLTIFTFFSNEHKKSSPLSKDLNCGLMISKTWTCGIDTILALAQTLDRQTLDTTNLRRNRR